MNNYNDSAITITFCDRGENHVGNQQIGNLATQGFTYNELKNIKDNLDKNNIESYLINLAQYLPKEYLSTLPVEQGNFVLPEKFNENNSINAGVLVIKNGIDIFIKPHDLLWDELKQLTYDKYALMYGQVRKKHARHNLCFWDVDQTPDYASGKGTIVNFQNVPGLSHVRKYLPELVGSKGTNLAAEANFYHNINKCGIGYHGDAERKIVIGLRLGCNFPLCYYWYMGKNRISQRIDFDIKNGDMYIMDEKACGFDYKKRNIPTLRHAAGCNKYIL